MRGYDYAHTNGRNTSFVEVSTRRCQAETLTRSSRDLDSVDLRPRQTLQKEEPFLPSLEY